MRCPYCDAWTEVKQTRMHPDGKQVRRHRACANLHTFTTYETVQLDVKARDKLIADAVVLRGKATLAVAKEFGIKSDSYVSRCVRKHYPHFSSRSEAQKRRFS